MEEPIPLKYEPSVPHSSTFSSFFSDNSLLIITPEKPSSFISLSKYPNINKENILDNLKQNIEYSDQFNVQSKYLDNISQEETHKYALQDIVCQDKEEDYIFKNLEKSKHLDILRRENELDKILKSNIGAFKNQVYVQSNEKTLEINNESVKQDLKYKFNGIKDISRGPKVTFDQAVSVHCFSPEDSNLSQNSDSTCNDSPQLKSKTNNLKFQSSFDLLPSFYQVDKASENLGTVFNNEALLNKTDKNCSRQESNCDYPTDDFNIINYTSCFPNGFYGSYKDNLSGDSIYNTKELRLSTNTQYGLTVDPLDISLSLYDSPLVIPAVDLSNLSLDSDKSTEFNTKWKNLFSELKDENCSNNPNNTDKDSYFNADISNKFYLPFSINNIKTLITANKNGESSETSSIHEYLIKGQNNKTNKDDAKYSSIDSLKIANNDLISNNECRQAENLNTNYTQNDNVGISKKSTANTNNNAAVEKPFDDRSKAILKNVVTKRSLSKMVRKNSNNHKSDTTALNKVENVESAEKNILSEARLNSLLTLSKKVETLKGKKFDEKIQINANLKTKIQEKALCKLNHPSSEATFRDLPSLVINESELVYKKNQFALPNRRPAYLDKHKHSINFKKPELLDFYSNSLFPQPTIQPTTILPNFLPAPNTHTIPANLEQGDDIYTKYIQYSKCNYKH